MSARLIGRTGAAVGVDCAVDLLLLVGAESSNTLRLVAQGVSRRHARVWRQDEEYWVEDLQSTNGTYLNGTRVARDRLRHLDVLTLGKAVDLIFINRAGSAAPRSSGIVEASLAWENGPDAGSSVQLARGELTLGRAEANGLIVDKGAVSKVHARLTLTADHLVVEDLASANGTFVNDVRAEGPTPLADGDRVSLAGQVTLRVSVRRDAAAAPINRSSSTAITPVFDAEWKTRLLWSADELAIVERECARAVEEAALRLARVSPAPPVAPDLPTPPEPPSAPVAPAPLVPTATDGAAMPPPLGPLAASLNAEATPPKGTAAAAFDNLILPDSLQALGRDQGAAVPADGPQTSRPFSGGGAAIPSAVLAGAQQAGDAGPDPSREPLRLQPIESVALVASDTTHQLDIGEHLLGRSADCRVHLNSPEISRHHARLRVRAEGVDLEDLGSGNGTMVNGRRVTGAAPLTGGDIIGVGDFTFRLELVRGQVPRT